MVTPENSEAASRRGFPASGGARPCRVSAAPSRVLALQTLVVVTLQGSAVQVGWLNSARWLPYLVLGLVVGALVDRARRRPLMMATDLARGVLLALIPLAWALDFLAFPLLLVLVVLFGTVSLINDAASMSFLPRLVSRAHLQRAHARLDGADAVAQTAGPAVAGALIRVDRCAAGCACRRRHVSVLRSHGGFAAGCGGARRRTGGDEERPRACRRDSRRSQMGLRRVRTGSASGGDACLVRGPSSALGGDRAVRLYPAAAFTV